MVPRAGEPLSCRLQENRARLVAPLGRMADVTGRDLLLPEPGAEPTPALLIHLEGMVDGRRLEAAIVAPLLSHGVALFADTRAAVARVPVAHIRGATSIEAVVRAVLRGEVALLVEGRAEALLLDVKDPPALGVDRAEVESSIYGSREGFSPVIETSLAMLRRRLPTHHLVMERLEIGALTHTTVVVVHLAGKAPRGLVAQVRRTLRRLHPEGMFSTEELGKALGHPGPAILPTVLITELPDNVARYLLSGHVAVLSDTSPRAVVLPGRLFELMSAPDDFFELRPYVLVTRVLRMMAFALATFLPSLYVAVTTFHLQALPTLLTLSLLAQREGAPLPTPVEAFVMVITFEMLREAGLRLPRPVGPTVSIVGGLVIGEAAMRAGITSPAMVLVVAATALATFAIPSVTLANAATIQRLLNLVLASLFGFFGLMIGYVLLITQLASLSSGRVPYGAPAMPLQPGHLLDYLGVMPRPPKGPGPTPDPTMVRPPREQRRP